VQSVSGATASVAWELWYRDTFDRECPPRIELRGRGLASGLVELWARHLFETVRPEARLGFSRFHLRCQPGGTVRIEGDLCGAARLRAWVFGPKQHTRRGYVAKADAALLRSLAAAHARLLRAGRDARAILDAAAKAGGRRDFETALAALLLN
jgi:hypothetical protein